MKKVEDKLSELDLKIKNRELRSNEVYNSCNNAHTLAAMLTMSFTESTITGTVETPVFDKGEQAKIKAKIFKLLHSV